jgi:HPt (histidine-containing phosphotransfer) domain-containing protein/two-component sensor histidine kinase
MLGFTTDLSLASPHGSPRAKTIERLMKADIKTSSTNDFGTTCLSDSSTARKSEMANWARQSFFDEAGSDPRASSTGPDAPGPSSAENSADALLDAIDELFDEYDTDADDWRTESIEFSLTSLLDDVVKKFGERAEVKGLQLSLDVSIAMPSLVRGDRERLRQILINLLANAVKFTERGTITVQCAVAEETSRRALIRLSVADTGVGFSRELANRLSGAPATQDSLAAQGDLEQGFGLTTCRRLVESLGGAMEIESQLGRGSKVSFSILLNKANRADRPPAIGPPAIEPPAEYQSQDTIHVASLLDRCFGDANFCTLMLRKFSHRAGDQLAALDRAARSGNAVDLAREAHSLKGLAGNLSAAPLQMSADRLEQVARRSELEEAGSLVGQVRDQVARCLAEIPRVLAQISRQE